MPELPQSAGNISAIEKEIQRLRQESERLTAALEAANAEIKQRSADAILPVPEMAGGAVVRT